MDKSKAIPHASISIPATFFFISALFERLAMVNESPRTPCSYLGTNPG
jgi:hypothetical protein